MRLHQWISARVRKGVVVAAGLVLAGGLIVLVEEASSSPVSAQKQGKIEATVFSYDGQDFVRTKTTFLNGENPPSIQNSSMTLQPIRPWSKNTHTPGPPLYLAEN